MTSLKAILGLASALSLAVGQDTDTTYTPGSVPDGVLHFPLTRPSLKKRVNQHIERLQRRADDPVDLSLLNKISSFQASIFVGSQKENVSVILDTGSSDLWIMGTENPYCKQVSNNPSSSVPDRDGKITCWRGTMFDDSKSSSFSANDTALAISYGDGTFANGTYAQDTISYGGATIKNANFALANISDSDSSVWGIGLKGLESIVTTYDRSGDFSPTYSNLPIQMKEQGIIGSVAYSLWLNSLDSSQGQLLFGGVDHAQYKGSLQKVPLLSTYTGAKPNEFQIKLDGIKIYQGDNEAQIVQCATSALLDSGTTFMMLPAAFLAVIVDSIGGQCGSSRCYAPCNLDGGLKFEFSGAEIEVPFSQLLIPETESTCVIGAMPSNTLILGDTFLRSAYVVYDLENLEVGLAQINYNPSSSSIEAITSGIPSATQAPSYSSTQLARTYVTDVATFITYGNGGTVSASAHSGTGDQTSLGGSDSSFVGGGGVGPVGTGAGVTTYFTTIGGGAGSATTTSAVATASSSSASKSNNQKNAGVPSASTSTFGSLFASVLGLLLYI